MSDCRVPMRQPGLGHPECLDGYLFKYCYGIGDYRHCRTCWPCAECDPCADCKEYPCPYAEVDHA